MPTGPEIGSRPLTATGRSTWNGIVLVSGGRPFTVSVTGPVVAPGGTCTVISVGLTARSVSAVVPIDAAQMGEFAGNALELTGRDGGVFVMSARGWESLHASQRAVIEARLDVLPVRIPAVENSGGSARCTLAGIHLPPR